MKIGDRVKINKSLKVYTHPEHRGKAFDIEGMEGEIVNIITDWNGRPISPNYPIQVQLGKKFKVHLSEAELELV
ncbi:ferredoxin thioredoxin reductase alpha chain [Thalassoporum mexicanum PCC 7367]|uniref:ferredoxin-thioredoxin reductase variable chain n=1 Tax=Thalassoporum mexicanum TaxID=3457544 RepID=UPI00029FD923|nr:ferredoxin-thioredoxin reductase variable chain [Pseudanabaena sp. PCC 7367]AFY71855.1 ferredoxin thioredoxin reductase alpha chain [Pseudanabaena sp. PCC 7367]